jgi:hypothetical protein
MSVADVTTIDDHIEEESSSEKVTEVDHIEVFY